MDALRIAFDTIIVGALALPWVFFAADLFFLRRPEDDNQAKAAWDFVTNGQSTVVMGVVLFGVTYFLGSVISRTAEDSFNDDELTRVWPTEDRIRTAEYCDQERNFRDTFKQVTPSYSGNCPKVDTTTLEWWTCNYWFGRFCDKYSNQSCLPPSLGCSLVSETQQVFRLQEAALLLNGQDKTERLGRLHDQIAVLRGAAFDGFLALVFSLFCWWARCRWAVRWRLGLVPLLFFALGVYWLDAHFQRTGINEAPFMEVTLILLGLAGLRGLSKVETREWYGRGLSLFFLLFTVVAYLAWWRTEVLYSRQVIYSFYAERHLAPK
jgi:hypothetical protein